MGDKKRTNYITEQFDGTVVLKDWLLAPWDGETYLAFSGKVSILRDQDIVGFKTEGNANANWIARVEGPTCSMNILGCQIRGVAEGRKALGLELEHVRAARSVQVP